MTPRNLSTAPNSPDIEIVRLRSKIVELETKIERAKLERKLASGGYSRLSDIDRLRVFIDSNILPIQRADIYGNITDANDAMLNLLGWTREELYAGKIKWTEFTPPEYLYLDEIAIAELKRNGQSGFYQKEYVKKNGERVPVLMQVTAINLELGDCFTVIIDLTENVKIERQLRESEARFRILAEAVPHIVWMCDLDGRLRYASQSWYDFTGRTPEEDKNGLTWQSILHPRDRTRTLEEVDRAGRDGTNLNLEVRYLAKTGLYRWHLVQAQTLVDPCTGEKLWIGTSTDIDDKKRAAEEIKESEMRFRMLADAIPQIVFTADNSGVIDYFNSRWFEYTGLSLAQSQNNGWQLLIHPDDLLKYREEWEKALDTGDSYEMEFRLRRAVGLKTAKNHAYRWHLGRAVALRGTDGSVIKWFATWTEIDDQRNQK